MIVGFKCRGLHISVVLPFLKCEEWVIQFIEIGEL